MQCQQHSLQLPVGLFDSFSLEQPPRNQLADEGDIRRGLQHVSQQAPGQRAAAFQIRGTAGDQLLKLRRVPVLHSLPPLRHLLFDLFPRPNQARVFGVFRNLVEFFLPAENLDIILVSERKHESAVVKLRAPRPAEHLMRGTWFDQFHFPRWPLEQRWQDDAPGRQIDSRCQGLGANANRKQLLLKELFDNPPILGQHSGVVNPHPALQ